MDTPGVAKEVDARIAFASAVTQAPVIDGKLDEECWKAAVPFSGFRLSHDNLLAAPLQASFRALYDEKAIYLGIEIMLPGAGQVREDLKAKPLLGGDGNPLDKTGDVYAARHSVEVFIQPPDRSRYVLYVASLDGYRYDGCGLDGAWNGQWTCGTSAGEDRWCLEMMIPAADLQLEKIPSTEGWRLNIIVNSESNYSTWSAVGHDFHNPFAFGALVTKDFPQWRADKMKEWTVARKQAADNAHKPGLMFGDRLTRTEAFTQTLPETTGGGDFGWEKITPVCALMNFVDAAYRSMLAEIRYADFFANE
jgi:hypothetical protein